MKVVIVIDVHVPYVLETDGQLIQNVADVVRRSHEGGDCFTCLVEHRSSRPVKPTHDAVANIVTSSDAWERLSKDTWSASPEVHKALERRNITPTEFVVCGAVAHECVLETLQDLRLLHPTLPVTLVTSACLSEGDTPYDWTAVKASLNVIVVERLTAAAV